VTFGHASKVIAAILALGAFAVAALSGAHTGNGVVSVLWQALVAMVVCYALGLALGSIGERTVREYIEQHKPGGAPAPTGTTDRELNSKRASE